VLLGLAPWAAGSARAATAPTVPDQWLPNPSSASWTYGWSDDQYSKPITYERYTVNKRSDADVQLSWTSQDAGSNDPYAVPNQGTIDYTYSDSGVVNTNWSSTAPPVRFPVLCAQANQCGNSLASTHYMLIWGSRSPVLQEPLLAGATWTSLGGQGNDVASKNRYAGVERVVVPAFPRGVFAAKVVSDITQAGAIGDPYGSGQRTVWWVYGVGPVKIVFGHAGGQVSQAQLYSTNLVPKTAPSDRAWLPLQQGEVFRYSYRNSRYMKQASRQQFTVGAVANSTSRVDVQDLAGPIRVRGSYVFSSGLSGVRNLTVTASAATRVKFPPLGPRSLPSNLRRRFFTPLDLMTYGFNPVIPAFPAKGQKWRSSKRGRDFGVFGVNGTTRVIGFQNVRTPAGRFRALLVESKLTQKGFPFGSGTRRSWFAAGVGLVKLQFRHADGSVSTVLRLR
jgi:hypothetical protein